MRGAAQVITSDKVSGDLVWSTTVPDAFDGGAWPWTPTEVPLTLSETGKVTYLCTDGRGNYCAVIERGTNDQGWIWSHDDGATWGFTLGRATGGGNHNAYPILWDGAQFVSYQDHLYTSPDGETWTEQTYSFDHSPFGQAYINGMYYAIVHDFAADGPNFGWLQRTFGGVAGYKLNAGHSIGVTNLSATVPQKPLVSNGIDTLLILTGLTNEYTMRYIHRPWAHDNGGTFGHTSRSTTACTFVGDSPFNFTFTCAVWHAGAWRGYGYWLDDPGAFGSASGNGMFLASSTDGEEWTLSCFDATHYPVDAFSNGDVLWFAMKKVRAGEIDNAIGNDNAGTIQIAADFPDDFGTDATHQDNYIAGLAMEDMHTHGEGGWTLSGTGVNHIRLHDHGGTGGFEIDGTGTSHIPAFAANEFKMHFQKRGSTRKKDFFYLHNVNNRVLIYPWDIEQSQQCSVIPDATALLRQNPPEVLPAGYFVPPYIKRHSEIYNNPTLHNGKPQQGWLPANTIMEDWARVRVLIDGKDMTYFRDIPCQVESWETNEPFGDASGSIYFPQITRFEHPVFFMKKWAPVQIQGIRPNGEIFDLFDGMLVDYHDHDIGTGIQVLGAFYESDLLLRRPTFQDEKVDIANHINTTINGFIMLYALDLAQMPEVLTGVERRARGFFEKTATGYIQNLLGFLEDAGSDKWTIECKSRQPQLVLKDRTTVHWTVMNGGRGIEVNLMQDLIADPNVIFGEGITKDNEFWRNTKYPGMFNVDPPLWPGFDFGLGSSGDYVLQWAVAANSMGYLAVVDDSFGTDDEAACTALQLACGLTVTSTVTAQTWASTFNIGSNNGDIGSVYIAPLAYYNYVEPALFNADGGLTALNPFYDPSIPRIERYTNYGPGVERGMAAESAQREIADNYFIKGWKGDITLTSDPQEGSRFEIRASQNIKLRRYRNGDQLLHIAKQSADMQTGSVHLTVDTRARDLPTLAAQAARDAEALQDPGSKYQTFRGLTYMKEDRWPMWDQESGCGIVPLHYTTAHLWNVLRIPFGKYGEIVVTDFITDPICKFSIGVFASPIFANTIASFGDPLTTENFWDKLDSFRLLYAVGQESVTTGKNLMAGYDPKPSNQGDPGLTGQLIDKASWTYASDNPPWMYVAIWTDIQTTIKGRFYAGTKSGEGMPVITGTPVEGGGGGG